MKEFVYITDTPWYQVAEAPAPEDPAPPEAEARAVGVGGWRCQSQEGGGKLTDSEEGIVQRPS